MKHIHHYSPSFTYSPYSPLFTIIHHYSPFHHYSPSIIHLTIIHHYSPYSPLFTIMHHIFIFRWPEDLPRPNIFIFRWPEDLPRPNIFIFRWPEDLPRPTMRPPEVFTIIHHCSPNHGKLEKQLFRVLLHGEIITKTKRAIYITTRLRRYSLLAV